MVGYDIENLANLRIKKLYYGGITTGRYGRTADKNLLVRRVNIIANHVTGGCG